jgi:hypothetical protein
MSPFYRIWRVAVLLVLGLSSSRAFPPAPDGMVYGMVKDQYGTPLMKTGYQVILQTTGGVRIATSIQPALAVGVNFKIKVPMDAGVVSARSVNTSLTAGVPFQLLVVVQGQTNLPIEMAGNYLQTGTPSFQLHQDLTLGTDVNGSGIPDQWIEQYLAQIGTNVALANINPNAVYGSNGRTLKQEYLLGNYPNDPGNNFSVTLVSQNAGSAVLRFTGIQGRNYSVSASPDLQNWVPVSFTVPASGATVLTTYGAPATQTLQFQTLQPTNAPMMQFFRLQLN